MCSGDVCAGLRLAQRGSQSSGRREKDWGKPTLTLGPASLGNAGLWNFFEMLEKWSGVGGAPPLNVLTPDHFSHLTFLLETGRVIEW